MRDRATEIEQAIGGAYEMPDGRKFWIDAPVAREIVRRIMESNNGLQTETSTGLPVQEMSPLIDAIRGAD